MARILLIDDEDLVRQTARTVLEYAGHTVTEFSNGKHGLKWLETNTADLLLTDMLMPDADGIEIILEARKQHPALKIVAMSGSRLHELYGTPTPHWQTAQMTRLMGESQLGLAEAPPDCRPRGPG